MDVGSRFSNFSDVKYPVKANYPVAYADAFAIAAAREYNAILLTGDPELKNVEELVIVEWLVR